MAMDAARIVQLIFRLFAGVLVCHFGMTVEQAAHWVQPAAEVSGALLLFLIDLAIHSQRWGKLSDRVHQTLEAGDQVLGRIQPETPGGVVNGGTIERPITLTGQTTLKILLVVVLAGFLLTGMPACGAFGTSNGGGGGTPISQQELALRQVTQAQTAYLAAVTTINVLHANGKISDQTMALLQPLEQVAYTYISAAYDAAAAGNTLDTTAQLRLFNQALLTLNAAYGGGGGGGVTPATAPATRPVASSR